MSECQIGCITSDDEGRGYYCEECPERRKGDAFTLVGPDGFTRLEPATSEVQWNALEMARKAELAERRAEDAEAEVERLLDVLAEVRRVFDLQCPPMSADRYVDRGAWTAHSWWNTVLGGILSEMRPLPIHRTEAGYPSCSTCDGGGCYDCTDPA